MYSAYGILVHAHMLYMPIPPSPHGVPHSQYTVCPPLLVHTILLMHSVSLPVHIVWYGILSSPVVYPLLRSANPSCCCSQYLENEVGLAAETVVSLQTQCPHIETI